MERKYLLITGVLIGLCICFGFAFISATFLILDKYSDSSHNASEDWLSFDNSTPEATAISIARLYYGQGGFAINIEDGCTFNASLSSDGYWIADVQTEGYDDGWLVTVDAKTGMSKENNGSWRSLDDLKAQYIAQLHTIGGGEESVGKPAKITVDDKEIWKVPVYDLVVNASDQYTGEIELVGYVYVDLATGKSKREGNILDFMLNVLQGNPDGWLTLKELDYNIFPDGSFKDALRDLYPE